MDLETLLSDSEDAMDVVDEINKDMSAGDVARWLEKKGNIYQPRFVRHLSHYIDGKEFLDLTDQDIRDMVPAIGIAKKISRLIPKEKTIATNLESNQDSVPSSINCRPSIGSPPSSFGSPSPSPSLISTSSTSTSAIGIPNHWRPETEACLEKKILTKESRSDIVRTLVTLTIAKFGSKPTRQHCQQFARQLILQYPFLKDDIGNGYTSWVEKMLERIRNLIKCDRKKSKDVVEAESTPKRSKLKTDTIIRRYPVTISRSETNPDQETISQHSKAISNEMAKSKPRERILLPLMKTTFSARWLFVTKDAKSIKEILEKYPSLKLPEILEQEICLIVDQKDVKTSFGEQWETFYPAIIAYGQSSLKKTTKSIVSSVEVLTEEQDKQIIALKVLCEAMAPKNIKDPCKFLYNEYEASVSVSDACTMGTNLLAPRIGTFHHESKEFFVFVENVVLCKASSFSNALFLMFTSYYVFYVEYPTQVKNTMYFLQDYIFNYPDSLNRNASYLAIASDIKRNI